MELRVNPNRQAKIVSDNLNISTKKMMTYTINSTRTVAVSTDTYWIPIDNETPRNVKIQLLTAGGVALYGSIGIDTDFYSHWCPLPKKQNEVPDL
jgi:hypothetical protein